MRIRSWCTCWPLHRLRTACAQSHFGVLFINRTRSLFFITKRSIISAKSPGFIIFWRTLICSPVINTDSGFNFISFTLCNSYKSEGNLSFYYRHWNDRPNRGWSKIGPTAIREKIWIIAVSVTAKITCIPCLCCKNEAWREGVTAKSEFSLNISVFALWKDSKNSGLCRFLLLNQ